MKQHQFKFKDQVMLTATENEIITPETDINGESGNKHTKTLQLTNNNGRKILTIKDIMLKSANGTILSGTETSISCFERYFITAQKKIKPADQEQISYYVYTAYSYCGNVIGDSICRWRKDKINNKQDSENEQI